MSLLNLEAKIRTVSGRKTNTLRAAGVVPAVVYGVGTEPQMITVDRNQFVKTYKAAGESSVVELSIDAKTALHVLIQDMQMDPLRDEVTHVDFRSIDMNKLIDAVVDLVFVGESLAVKALGGTFVPARDSVTVRCLPSKLVRNISIDISALKTFDDAIRVSDLPAMEGVHFVDDPTTTIAAVQAPRSEAEMDDLNKSVVLDVTAVEVEKKAKEDAAAAATDGDKKPAAKK